MCVGNGYILEAVNDVLNVFSATGSVGAAGQHGDQHRRRLPEEREPRRRSELVLRLPAGDQPDDGHSRPVRDGPELPLRRATQRLFVVVLTLEVVPTTGAFTGKNHIDLAVSQTAEPTGLWNIYRLPVQDDGTDGTPDHGCALNDDGTGHGPCLGDYPHIGADANGIYVTTNEYAFFPTFVYMGAQIYAFSKAALAAGAPIVDDDAVRQVRALRSGRPSRLHRLARAVADPRSVQHQRRWHRVLPQLRRGRRGAVRLRRGLHRHGDVDEPDRLDAEQHVVPELGVAQADASSTKVLTVGQYAVPPRQKQPGSGTLATDGYAAGLLHQRHDHGDDRRRRLLAAPVRRRAGPRRGHLAAGLERHPHAAGDVGERQAVGLSRHGAQPGRRSAARRHRLTTSSIPTPARSSTRATSGRLDTTSRTRRSASPRAAAA